MKKKIDFADLYGFKWLVVSQLLIASEDIKHGH